MKVHEDIYVAFIRTLAVLPHNTVIYYAKLMLKSNHFRHCWQTWHHLASSQLPSGLSAGPTFKWRGYRMRIGKQKEDKRVAYLISLDQWYSTWAKLPPRGRFCASRGDFV